MIAQFVVMRDLAFMAVDLRKKWDLPDQVRQKHFRQQADQPGEKDVN